MATIAFSIYRYPGIVAAPVASKFLPLFFTCMFWYVWLALRLGRAATRDDFVVLHHGARWGVVIALAWIVEVVGGSLILPGSPVGPLATIVAVLLPAVAGASGTAVTGRIDTGARIGFWSGVLSGMITFLAMASVGYLAATFPELLREQETPPDIGRAYTAAELGTYYIADYLASGVSHLLIVRA